MRPFSSEAIMKSWYEIKAKSTDVVDISLHDEIGMWGISASAFIRDLKATNAKSINLSIHSPGGNALDGLAMYNALVAHPAKVNAHVAGLAASAASIVLMAGDHITMPQDAFVMIHNPYTMAMGDSEEMRAVAETLDKIQASLSNIYQRRTGKSESDINSMMASETWLSSADALDNGFIDAVSDPVGVAAKAGVFNKYFKSLPIDNKHDLEGINTIKEFERFLSESGGISNGLATALASRAKVIFQGEPDDKPKQSMTELLNALERMKIPKSLNG
jgi:ATP-dependent Clp protease protease subunit